MRENQQFHHERVRGPALQDPLRPPLAVNRQTLHQLQPPRLRQPLDEPRSDHTQSPLLIIGNQKVSQHQLNAMQSRKHALDASINLPTLLNKQSNQLGTEIGMSNLGSVMLHWTLVHQASLAGPNIMQRD